MTDKKVTVNPKWTTEAPPMTGGLGVSVGQPSADGCRCGPFKLAGVRPQQSSSLPPPTCPVHDVGHEWRQRLYRTAVLDEAGAERWAETADIRSSLRLIADLEFERDKLRAKVKDLEGDLEDSQYMLQGETARGP